MRVMLFRHGIAMDRLEFARHSKNDDERPLVEKGRNRMARAALALRKIEPKLDLIVTSPLVRAVQTADFLREVFPKADYKVSEVMRPTSPYESFIDYLKQIDCEDPDDFEVCFVGHEPHLSLLSGYHLTGEERALFTFKKAGAACFLSYNPLEKTHFQLEWLLRPRQLRNLAERPKRDD